MTSLTRIAAVALFALAALHTAQAQAPAQRVAVASRALARDVTLTPADFGYALATDTPTRTTPPTVPALEPAAASDTLVGWMTRRVIAAGEVLRTPGVTPPQLVRSGDIVAVTYSADGVTITMRGRATRSAALGERITVRMDNQRKLEATVVAVGRVRVT